MHAYSHSQEDSEHENAVWTERGLFLFPENRGIVRKILVFVVHTVPRTTYT